MNLESNGDKISKEELTSENVIDKLKICIDSIPNTEVFTEKLLKLNSTLNDIYKIVNFVLEENDKIKNNLINTCKDSLHYSVKINKIKNAGLSIDELHEISLKEYSNERFKEYGIESDNTVLINMIRAVYELGILYGIYFLKKDI